jgi:hypothetical protein
LKFTFSARGVFCAAFFRGDGGSQLRPMQANLRARGRLLVPIGPLGGTGGSWTAHIVALGVVGVEDRALEIVEELGDGAKEAGVAACRRSPGMSLR